MKYTVALLAAILLCAGFVIAEPSAPPSITVIASEARNLSELSSITVAAQGGNVTALQIDALTVTNSWQGYYGNISGGIALDDASNNTFYNWSITGGSNSGEVYATRNESISWVTVNCTNATERNAEETALGQNTNDGDSVTNTFNTTDHPSFLVGSLNITQDSCYSTNVNTNGAIDTNRWHQILLSDGSQNIIYSTIIDAGQSNFEGNAADFQLLVGEDDHAGQEGPTTYYVWVELG